ncbi:NlpC/P60 family protein [Streptomyces ziwulingensis]|uniref:NlpC/P60 family protein n=1 Tax=Streptomyces ziwulingensis TaxID=1045501 RepID=A0ABP9B4W7_9ACTN
MCTAAMTAGVALAPLPAAAEPGPGEGAAARPVAALLTDLQRLYREAEKATEVYNGTEEKLRAQRDRVKRLDAELTRARRSLRDSRDAAGMLARQQYQTSSDLSPYVRLLLARDPQRALDQGRVIGRVARDRAETVGRLVGGEKRAAGLARAARKALDERLVLTERRERERDVVRERLGDVEEMLSSLDRGQLTELAAFERDGVAKAQERFLASGALGAGAGAAGPADDGKGAGAPDEAGWGRPSAGGNRALRFAVEQLGKPYEWGAEGPASFDCSGLTSVAWQRAGTPIPRTSQEQWARLDRIELDELRPGDLVVYFPEATHVALYLGDGKVVQAPRPGARVKVSPIAANPVLGAVRPDPAGEPVRRYAPPRLPAGAADGTDQGYASGQAPAAAETSLR